MPVITVTERDLLRSKIITPGWYRVKVENIGELPSKDKASTNYPVEAVVLHNADTGDKEFAGVPLDGIPTWFFNSKVISYLEGFIKAAGGEWILGRIDLDAAKGVEMDVYISNNLYEGRLQNRVEHQYRKPRE